MNAVVLGNLVSTLLMAGMIATIHVVHYPLFVSVGADRYTAYMDAHRTRITALIALPWAVEGITSAWLALAPPPGVPGWLAWLGLGLAAVPVVITLGWAVPAHSSLASRFDPDVHGGLMRANAARAWSWVAHAVVAVLIAQAAIR